MFCPRVGLGMAPGSNPGPGSRTTISIPFASSQATHTSTLFVASCAQPCRMAFASASRSAVSISNSLPFEHSIARASAMICSTAGEIASSRPGTSMRTRVCRSSGSKSQCGSRWAFMGVGRGYPESGGVASAGRGHQGLEGRRRPLGVRPVGLSQDEARGQPLARGQRAPGLGPEHQEAGRQRVRPGAVRGGRR